MKRMLEVIEAHVSDYSNPIVFSAGDAVTIGRRDDEFPGWIRVQTADRNEGWAPESYLTFTGGRSATADCDYCARELDTSLGEALEMLLELNGWIWCRRLQGEEGWVPAKSVRASLE